MDHTKPLTQKQQQWLIANNAQYPVKCKISTCNNFTKWAHTKYGSMFRIYCSPGCAKLDRGTQQEKIKLTKLKNHGCVNYTNRDKAIQTNITKYGVSNYTSSPQFLQQSRQSISKKFGETNAMKVQSIVNDRQQSSIKKYGVLYPLQSAEVKDKVALTNFDKYGVVNPLACKEIREKIKQTMIERYGVSNPGNSNIIIQKTKKTNNERYGCHPSQTTTIKDKTKDTNMVRYGSSNPSKSNIIKDKIQQTNIKHHGGVHNTQQHMVNSLPHLTDYSWLIDQYIVQNKTALQISKELGVDGTTVAKYLRKHEIQIKQSYWSSYKCQIWLEDQSCDMIYEWTIPDTRYRADGYCELTNTVYEFYGDYWHGNPQKFEPDEINEVVGKSMGELYQQTIEREMTIKSLGYNLVVVWEGDWINNRILQ